ncbi:5-formyltetrahydrofolate cyclo-ligase [Rossellomorea marisflavi]|uniref:5-formyltetrahydrofolate cyclo-ligase n=1 Tax=Rossellomorea marisflavi TaxID=189381 RepID=UPI00351614FE
MKQIMRERQLEKLANIPFATGKQKGYRIEQNLFTSGDWTGSRVIAVTVSKPPEIDTWGIVKRGWEEGKIMVVPRCLPKTRGMDFYALNDFGELEQVYYGLYEPRTKEAEPIALGEIDLMIVPGLAFTTDGYRLGFGGGYYDRILTGYKGTTISLAADEQLVAEVPVESFDLPVQKIVTESGIIHCGD